MKHTLSSFVSPVIAVLMVGCGKASTTVEERLWKETKHCLIFPYDDFGPGVLTYTSLGKPVFTNGEVGADNKDAKDKIRIVVIVSSYSVAEQRVLHDLAGRHEAGFEYRYVPYFNALVVLNDVLKEPKLPEAERKKVAATMDRITKEMGDDDHVREVGGALMDEIDAAAKKLDRAAVEKAREFQVKSGPGV